MWGTSLVLHLDGYAMLMDCIDLEVCQLEARFSWRSFLREIVVSQIKARFLLEDSYFVQYFSLARFIFSISFREISLRRLSASLSSIFWWVKADRMTVPTALNPDNRRVQVPRLCRTRYLSGLKPRGLSLLLSRCPYDTFSIELTDWNKCVHPPYKLDLTSSSFLIAIWVVSHPYV